MTREEYQRRLHNLLVTVHSTLYTVLNKPSATFQDKLTAIHAVEKSLPDIKQALIYLMNTGG